MRGLGEVGSSHIFPYFLVILFINKIAGQSLSIYGYNMKKFKEIMQLTFFEQRRQSWKLMINTLDRYSYQVELKRDENE